MKQSPGDLHYKNKEVTGGFLVQEGKLAPKCAPKELLKPPRASHTSNKDHGG